MKNDIQRVTGEFTICKINQGMENRGNNKETKGKNIWTDNTTYIQMWRMTEKEQLSFIHTCRC